MVNGKFSGGGGASGIDKEVVPVSVYGGTSFVGTAGTNKDSRFNSGFGKSLLLLLLIVVGANKDEKIPNIKTIFNYIFFICFLLLKNTKKKIEQHR